MRKQLIILMMMAFPAIIMAQTAIDCIDPKYEHVDDSCEFVLVDYRDSIKVWENCCLESYTQSPPPGEVSAPGDKLEVTLTAIDCQGNVASISFPVFVLDTIPPKFYCDDDGDVGKPPVEEIRRRVIVLTDPNVDPNKESDDKMSLVRLMLYSNEFDIEGIVATCSHNLYARYTEPIYDAIDAFEQALPNLKNHAGNWPTADYLRSVTALGPASYGTMFALNEEPISDGGRLIVNALMVDDPRPLWVTIWGDGAVIVQALEYIKATQGEQAALDASLKLRVLDNAGQDDSGAWLKAAYHYPYTFYVRWVRGGMAMDSISDTPTGISWFPYCGECAKGDVSYVSDYWVEKNIQPKGPLGAEYPDRRYLKEGDSPT
ncbi:MAG TPA: DUF1593 domain-containing protein, partial [Methylophaga sp.]|nr:DUF1593 domain-containing protein [Methylophaga sp.]